MAGFAKTGIASPSGQVAHRVGKPIYRPPVRPVARRIPWIFKVLGVFAAIVVQIPFSLDSGIHSRPVFAPSTGAKALPLQDRPVPADEARKVEPTTPAPASSGADKRAGREAAPASPLRSHPWIGNGSTLITGLLLLGASDPALRSRLAAMR